MFLQFRQARCLARLNAFALRRPEHPVSCCVGSLHHGLLLLSSVRDHAERQFADSPHDDPLFGRNRVTRRKGLFQSVVEHPISVRSKYMSRFPFMHNASHDLRRLGLNRSRRRSVDYSWRPSAIFHSTIDRTLRPPVHSLLARRIASNPSSIMHV